MSPQDYLKSTVYAERTQDSKNSHCYNFYRKVKTLGDLDSANSMLSSGINVSVEYVMVRRPQTQSDILGE